MQRSLAWRRWGVGVGRAGLGRRLASAQPKAQATPDEGDGVQRRRESPMGEPVTGSVFGETPVEAKSVARGLVLNRIDHRMLVFPELETKDQLDSVTEFKKELDDFFEKSVDSAAIDAEGRVPDEVWSGLAKRGAFAIGIAREFGGPGLSRKEQCLMTETLGRDWSIFASTAVHNNLVSYAIQTFGTQEQKLKYLPRLASGELKAAWALSEEVSGQDVAGMETLAEVEAGSKDRLISGSKAWVTNGRDADLLLVFASINPKPKLGKEALYNPLVSAFLVERSPAVRAVRRRETLGLRGAEMWDLELDGVRVAPDQLLGGQGMGFQIARRTSSAGRNSFGAAVAAWMRRLLGQVAERANTELRFEGRLSTNATVQRRVQDLATSTFALESLTYFVAGLEEEEAEDGEGLAETRDFSLDADISHRLAKRVLTQGVTAAMELLGSAYLERGSEISRLFRDAATLTGFLGHPDVLTESITLDVLTTWAAEHAGGIAKMRRPDHNPFYYINTTWQKMKNKYAPVKLHYLNEKLHPSLEEAARMFELSLGRFEVILSDLLENYGRGLEEESMVMERLADILTDLNAMVALLARTSRSYAIGLRNCDEELVWCHGFINDARRRVTERLDQIISVQHMHRDDLLKKAVAQHVLDANHYPMQHPLQRNW